MNSVQSASCIGLAFASDSMCFNCRNICSEPAVRIASKREIQRSEDSLKTFQPARQNVIQSVKKYGIYCVENHPGRDIILGTAEMYREGKLKESDYYHKVQHLMIQDSKGKQIHWNDHIEILLWTLRGYIRFGRGFIDHLNGQGYKFEKEEHDSLVFRFNRRFLLVPSLKTCQRYSPAYAACDGISISQARILLQCLKKENTIGKTSSKSSIYLVNLQYDGILLKPCLEYCRHHHSCIGLTTGPVPYEEIK